MTKQQKSLQTLLEKFVLEQEPLPTNMAKVLHDNLWDLYESEPRMFPDASEFTVLKMAG